MCGTAAIRYGRTRQDKQRWYCLRCHHTFIWRNAGARQQRERIWFTRWIQEGYSVRQLAQNAPYALSKLHQIITAHLRQTPPVRASFSTVKHILCDGTFLYGRQGLFTVMDAKHHELLAGIYGVREGSMAVYHFLQSLQSKGLCPQSATIDGNPQIMRYLRLVWPALIIQRCIVHVQRQGLAWCRRNPKRTDAKQLRTLFLQLSAVHTASVRNRWCAKLALWEAQYGRRIEESPERGWVFSDLKRARSMVLKALPNLFHYLQDPGIPTSTNGLEGYFSRLKLRYHQHRGLAIHRRNSYFQWYFHYCRR